jgi:Trypsin
MNDAIACLRIILFTSIAACATASSAQTAARGEPEPKGRLRFDAKASPQQNEGIRRTISSRVNALHAKIRELDLQISNARAAAALESQPAGIDRLESAQSGRREDLTAELTAWLAAQKRFQIESICGLKDDSQDVELYDGSAGPSRQFVMARQPATAQIQWNDDLRKRFSGSGDDPGDVQGARWCTGTLIQDNLLLTAGHCFDAVSADWSLPKRAHKPLAPAELATLMHVNFNYQIDAGTRQIRVPTSYPILRLVEHRLGGLDYAIVELGASGGDLPQKNYAPAARRGGIDFAGRQDADDHPASGRQS